MNFRTVLLLTFSFVSVGAWSQPPQGDYRLVRVVPTATCSIDRQTGHDQLIAPPLLEDLRLPAGLPARFNALAAACTALDEVPVELCPLIQDHTVRACAQAQAPVRQRWVATRSAERAYSPLAADVIYQSELLASPPSVLETLSGMLVAIATARDPRRGPQVLMHPACADPVQVSPVHEGASALPFIVEIHAPMEDKQRPCGGVQVGQRHILTAAHCVPSGKPGALVRQCGDVKQAVKLDCSHIKDVDVAICAAEEPLACDGTYAGLALAPRAEGVDPNTGTLLVTGWKPVGRIPLAHCAGPASGNPLSRTIVSRGVCGASGTTGTFGRGRTASCEPYLAMDPGDSGMPVFDGCGPPTHVSGLALRILNGEAVFAELTCGDLHDQISNVLAPN